MNRLMVAVQWQLKSRGRKDARNAVRPIAPWSNQSKEPLLAERAVAQLRKQAREEPGGHPARRRLRLRVRPTSHLHVTKPLWQARFVYIPEVEATRPHSLTTFRNMLRTPNGRRACPAYNGNAGRRS